MTTRTRIRSRPLVAPGRAARPGPAKAPLPRRRARRFLRTTMRWMPVAVLAPVVLVASLGAFVLDRPADAGAQRSDRTAGTPILSSRRIAVGLANGQTDRALRAELDAFVARQPPNTCLTVEVPNFRYDHRGSEPQVPASLMKILTGHAALELVGPDTALETSALTDAPVDGGVIHGNLYLKGGGDPLLLSEGRHAQLGDDSSPYTNLGDLADRVAEAGITKVLGAVVGDDSRYDNERFHPMWPRRYISQGQSRPISALTVDAGARSGVDRPLATDAAAAFVEALAARGISVAGDVSSGAAPDDGVVIATTPSTPMRYLVAHILASSDNTVSEALLKELGVTAAGTGSFAAGTAAVAHTVAAHGADDNTRIVDGSGLSTENAVTCALVASVLFDSVHADVLADGLAVAGETGTMRQRWRDHPLAGLVRGKTGSLSTVRALAGYVDPSDPTEGDSVRFVYIVNVDEPAAMTESVLTSPLELAEILARYPRVADISGLVPGNR